MLCKVLDYPVLKMLSKVYVPGAFVGFFVLAMAFFFNLYLGSSNLLNLIIGISVTGVFGVIAIIMTSGYAGLILNKVSFNNRI